MRRAAALGSNLDDALVLPRCREHRLPFDHVHADRLLHPDVSARLDGGNHRQSMPVIGSVNDDNVEVLFLEHLPVVPVGARAFLGSLPLGHHVGRAVKRLLIDVAQGYDFDGCDLDQAEEVALAVPARPDDSDALRFVVCKNGEARPAKGQTGGTRTKKKLTAIHARDGNTVAVEPKAARRTEP